MKCNKTICLLILLYFIQPTCWAQSGGIGTPPPPPFEHGSSSDLTPVAQGGGAPISGSVYWLTALGILYAGGSLIRLRFRKH